MLSRSIFRKFVATDFPELDKFFRFNPAYADSCVVKRDMAGYDTFRRLCQIVGHWELNGYGWHGLFQHRTGALLGIIGAEYNHFLRNAEFTLISSSIEAKTRLTWMLTYHYMLAREWENFGVDTYAIIAPENLVCINLVEKCGSKFIKDDLYAEGSKGKLYKLDWQKADDRFRKSRVFGT